MPPPELDLNALFDADITTGKGQRKRKSPRQRSRRKSPAILFCLLLLAVGFVAGFFSYDLLDRDEPFIEPIATIAPNFGYIPSTHYELYSNDDLTCYVYTEKMDNRVTLSPLSYAYSYTLLDGDEEYGLGNWPIVIGPDSCNFFLRVEFSEEGRNRFDMDAFRLKVNEKDPNDTGIPYLHLGMAGYNEGEGLFIFGYLPETISLELYYAEDGSTGYRLFYHDASPIGNGISSYTRSLVELALAADKQVWTENNGELPESFADGTMFADILKQSDCIDCLLEYAASTDPVERVRSIKLLEHSAFQSKISDIQRIIFRDLKQYVTCIVYSEMVEEINPSASGAPGGPPYFLAPDGRWELGFDAPQWLQDSPPSEYNFFARLELTAFAKSHYDPAWEVIISEISGSGNHILGIRKYYDSEKEVAGWFLYGYLEEPADLRLVCFLTGERLYTTAFHAAPIGEEFLYG